MLFHIYLSVDMNLLSSIFIQINFFFVFKMALGFVVSLLKLLYFAEIVHSVLNDHRSSLKTRDVQPLRIGKIAPETYVENQPSFVQRIPRSNYEMPDLVHPPRPFQYQFTVFSFVDFTAFENYAIKVPLCCLGIISVFVTVLLVFMNK